MSAYNPHPLAPVPDIQPAPPGGVRTVTHDDDLRAVREGIASGLLSSSEAEVYKRMVPLPRRASSGTGRRIGVEYGS